MMGCSRGANVWRVGSRAWSSGALGAGTAGLWDKSPTAVAEAMWNAGQHRAYVVQHKGELVVSHPVMESVRDALLKNRRDFDDHEAIFIEIGPRTGALLGAYVHRTIRGQAAGGVRLWTYDTFGEYVTDGLRLAQGMGRKNALAGLWWGGGKGVIARTPGEKWKGRAFRDMLFSEYGAFMTSLRGCYVTAEDVGVTTDDMTKVFERTRFTTCIPVAVGGSGNPSILTGWGVARGMEGALDFLQMGSIEGKRVAIQGVGNVARALISRLLELNVGSIIASDISAETVDMAREMFLSAGDKIQLRVVENNDVSILFEDVDIVSPCALGGVLNGETIPHIRAKIVCGAANNQLLDDEKDDKALQSAGISYVPDFIANRMGIVNCSNEQYGFVNDDPAIALHLDGQHENSVFIVTKRVLGRAKDEGISSAEAANRLADELAKVPHPIWGHRSKAIIESLVKNQWHMLPPLNSTSPTSGAN